MIASDMPIVVVVGSLHYDIMVAAPDLPRRGETVTGFAWRPKFGGKGGNQALAVAKAGAVVRMVGAVGDDDFGRFLLKALEGGNVDTSRVACLPDVATGMSVAISEPRGDYGAVIVSGANLLANPAAVAEPSLWMGARALIIQNEMPEPLNVSAARAARAAGAMVCLNAAPYRPLPQELTALVDLIVVNAIEAGDLGKVTVTGLSSATAAAETLATRFPSVVVTAGSEGVAGVQQGQAPVTLAALPVRLVSTHGAGDVFIGALVTALASSLSFAESLKSANAAAALHVSTRAG